MAVTGKDNEEEATYHDFSITMTYPTKTRRKSLLMRRRKRRRNIWTTKFQRWNKMNWKINNLPPN
jgi:hypothetical protein